MFFLHLGESTPADIVPGPHKSDGKKSSNSCQILKANCQRHGLEIRKETQSNGNCFFEAVFDQLERLGLHGELQKYESALKLRECLVNFMENNDSKVC